MNVMFMSGADASWDRGRHADFYIMKTPSRGRWESPQEFSLSNKERDLLYDLLPVLCDADYDRPRREALDEIQRRYGIPARGVMAIPGNDSTGMMRMVSDKRGRRNIKPATRRSPDDMPDDLHDQLYADEYDEYDEYGDNDPYEDYDPMNEYDQYDAYDEPDEYDEYDDDNRNRNEQDEGQGDEYDDDSRQEGRQQKSSEPFDYEHPFGDEEDDDWESRRGDYGDYDGYDDEEYDDRYDNEYDDDRYGDEYDENRPLSLDPDIVRSWDDKPKQPSKLGIALIRVAIVLGIVMVLALAAFIGLKVAGIV
jgi:hypothetical protein